MLVSSQRAQGTGPFDLSIDVGGLCSEYAFSNIDTHKIWRLQKAFCKVVGNVNIIPGIEAKIPDLIVDYSQQMKHRTAV